MPITNNIQLLFVEKNNLYTFIKTVLSKGHYIFIITRGIASEIAKFLCNIFNELEQKDDEWQMYKKVDEYTKKKSQYDIQSFNKTCNFYYRIKNKKKNYRIDILGANNQEEIGYFDKLCFTKDIILSSIYNNLTTKMNEINGDDSRAYNKLVDNNPNNTYIDDVKIREIKEKKDTLWEIYKTILINYVLHLITNKKISYIAAHKCKIDNIKQQVYFFDDTEENINFFNNNYMKNNTHGIIVKPINKDDKKKIYNPEKLFLEVYKIIKPKSGQFVEMENIDNESDTDTDFEMVTGENRIGEVINQPPKEKIISQQPSSRDVSKRPTNERKVVSVSSSPLPPPSYQPNKQTPSSDVQKRPPGSVRVGDEGLYGNLSRQPYQSDKPPVIQPRR